MLYSNRRRSHEPTNGIKISTDTKTNKQTVPSLFLTNACHILNKIDELSSVAEINDPDLICISESWPPAYPTELYLLDLTISCTEKIEEHQAAV